MNKFIPLCLVITGVLLTHTVYADSAKLINTINGHTYKRFDTAKTWSQAKDYCASQGGYLATITSKAENDWIVSKIVQGAAYSLLGGTDTQEEGMWKWVTDEPFVYSNWNTGEPNNGAGGAQQNYNAIYSNGTWDDAWGDYNASYICEWNSSKPKLELSWEIPINMECSRDMFNNANRTMTSTFVNIVVIFSTNFFL